MNIKFTIIAFPISRLVSGVEGKSGSLRASYDKVLRRII
jgi:hypothetical protein